MTTAPQLATRTRRARVQSVCALCPQIIMIGNSIGKLPAGGWAHARCIVAANTNVRPEQPGGSKKGTP
jgi:hypothetical protein